MPDPALPIDAELELAIKAALAAHYADGALAGAAIYASQSGEAMEDADRIVIACFDEGGELAHANISEVFTDFILYTPIKTVQGNLDGQIAKHQAAVQALKAIFQVERNTTVCDQLNAANTRILVSCYAPEGAVRRGKSPEGTCYVTHFPVRFTTALAEPA